MSRHMCDPEGTVRVWPVPDLEPVDTSVMTETVRAYSITDADVAALEAGE